MGQLAFLTQLKHQSNVLIKLFVLCSSQLGASEAGDVARLGSPRAPSGLNNYQLKDAQHGFERLTASVRQTIRLLPMPIFRDPIRR